MAGSAALAMRGFDYLIVLFSVLIGLSLSRLLVGLARVVVDPQRRIHWLPLLWTIQLFIFQVVLWWLVFQRAEQESWSFLHYVVLIGYPVLFFQAVLSIQSSGPTTRERSNRSCRGEGGSSERRW
jgi:hypothetical protein